MAVCAAGVGGRGDAGHPARPGPGRGVHRCVGVGVGMVVISLSVGEWVGGVHRCVGVGMVLSIPLSLWVGGWVGVGGCRDVCRDVCVCVCAREREDLDGLSSAR